MIYIRFDTNTNDSLVLTFDGTDIICPPSLHYYLDDLEVCFTYIIKLMNQEKGLKLAKESGPTAFNYKK